jgi:hypothetical protein
MPLTDALEILRRRYGRQLKIRKPPVWSPHWRAGRSRTGGIPWTGRKASKSR